MKSTTRRSLTAGLLSLVALGTAAMSATPATAAAGTQHRGAVTLYNNTTGLGACGWTNNDNELVAAVSPELFSSNSSDNDPICGKSLLIHGLSGTWADHVVVRIVDRCPGCGKDEVDLSPAAFRALGEPGVGRLYTEWYEL
ncbi:RlpA-like double-psi beta-barrel domain-containing protein [Streptomyces sp. NPDC007264]|uniref:RlpA-like double-psi beta-barrel domain-containing protein n=1 Tax=Streptomyces sp. NPDC007264 TaxID=3364777 RepID=UPI0036DC4FD0